MPNPNNEKTDVSNAIQPILTLRFLCLSASKRTRSIILYEKLEDKCSVCLLSSACLNTLLILPALFYSASIFSSIYFSVHQHINFLPGAIKSDFHIADCYLQYFAYLFQRLFFIIK